MSLRRSFIFCHFLIFIVLRCGELSHIAENASFEYEPHIRESRVCSLRRTTITLTGKKKRSFETRRATLKANCITKYWTTRRTYSFRYIV